MGAAWTGCCFPSRSCWQKQSCFCGTLDLGGCPGITCAAGPWRADALAALRRHLNLCREQRSGDAHVRDSAHVSKMLHAADTALADSLVVYVTGGNVLGIGTVLISALLFPFLTARLHRPRFLPTGLAFWSLAVAVVGLGFVARPWVMLRGLSRNALSALIYTTLLQRDAHGAASAIEVPPLPTLRRGHSEATDRHRPDLSSLLGAAKDRSVLWVVLESTAARYLRPYGAAEDPMPNLSELGARSLRFDSIYAAYPRASKDSFLRCAP